MRTKSNLTYDTLTEFLIYDKDTGVFTRRKQNGPFREGSIAGTTLNTGYVAIIIQGTPYQAHRLAWLYSYGSWPAQYIDHINGIKSDNRLTNLRDVSWSTNQHNLKSAKITNKIGFLGVSRYKNRWIAQIQKNKVKTHIGVYDTPEEASEAYQKVKALLANQ